VRLAVTLLGLDLLTIEITTDHDAGEPGDSMSIGVGFTASTGDQAWQPGVDR
jgi:hypothetical protein